MGFIVLSQGYPAFINIYISIMAFVLIGGIIYIKKERNDEKKIVASMLMISVGIVFILSVFIIQSSDYRQYKVGTKYSDDKFEISEEIYKLLEKEKKTKGIPSDKDWDSYEENYYQNDYIKNFNKLNNNPHNKKLPHEKERIITKKFIDSHNLDNLENDSAALSSVLWQLEEMDRDYLKKNK